MQIFSRKVQKWGWFGIFPWRHLNFLEICQLNKWLCCGMLIAHHTVTCMGNHDEMSSLAKVHRVALNPWKAFHSPTLSCQGLQLGPSISTVDLLSLRNGPSWFKHPLFWKPQRLGRQMCLLWNPCDDKCLSTIKRWENYVSLSIETK